MAACNLEKSPEWNLLAPDLKFPSSRAPTEGYLLPTLHSLHSLAEVVRFDQANCSLCPPPSTNHPYMYLIISAKFISWDFLFQVKKSLPLLSQIPAWLSVSTGIVFEMSLSICCSFQFFERLHPLVEKCLIFLTNVHLLLFPLLLPNTRQEATPEGKDVFWLEEEDEKDTVHHDSEILVVFMAVGLTSWKIKKQTG